ncbi:MAG: DUF2148 domain-containing protein [Christensenella sp.]
MIYDAQALEEETVMITAAHMCAAARTAPKTRGIDYITTCVLTGDEKDALADEMQRLAPILDYPFFERDAANIRASLAVVLVGTTYQQRGLNEGCGYCNQKNCAECVTQNSVCAYDNIDLGIAIGSAVSIAADARIDNRVLFSAGRAALSLKTMGDEIKVIIAIPLSATKKSPYFDRK